MAGDNGRRHYRKRYPLNTLGDPRPWRVDGVYQRRGVTVGHWTRTVSAVKMADAVFAAERAENASIVGGIKRAKALTALRRAA